MNAPEPGLRTAMALQGERRGVGARLPLVDGVEKVTGAARYTADLLVTGALVGKLLRSPYAHAELLEVDACPRGVFSGPPRPAREPHPHEAGADTV